MPLPTLPMRGNDDSWTVALDGVPAHKSNSLYLDSDAATPQKLTASGGALLLNGVDVGGVGAATAADLPYDNATSGLTGDDVQEVIDELAAAVEDGTTADSVTIVRNTSVPGQTSFDAQTAVIVQLGQAYVENNAVTTKQNNLAVASTTRVISYRGNGLGIISGFTGLAPGRRLTVSNDTTDYALIIEPNSTNSNEECRVKTRGGWPIVLFPGDSAELLGSEWINRWIWLNPPANPMGCTEFTDFIAGVVGPFSATLGGTGTITANTHGVDATEKAKGVIALNTGTGTTDRAAIGMNATGTLAPTVGPMMFVVRAAVNTATDGTNTFTCYFGLGDAAGGTLTDGACFEYRWNGSAPEWNYIVADAGSITRAASGVTVDTTFKVLMGFVNSDGTRVDFVRSEDSMSFTKEASVTTDLPEVGDVTAFGAACIKSAGGTTRAGLLDYIGYRVDGGRG